jgi:hypothetical protein
VKKHALAIVALAAMATSPLLSGTTEESETEFIFTPKYVSAFMFRGVKLGSESFQPTLGIEKGPWSLVIFANIPLDNKHYPFVKNECDFEGSYEWELNEHFSISPGLILYTFSNASKHEGEYKIIVEPKVSFGYKIAGLDFSLNYYYDFMQKGPTYEFGAEYSIPLGHDHAELQLSALAGRYSWSDMVNDSPVRFSESGDYVQAGAAFKYEFNKHSNMTVGWYYEKGFNNYEKEAGHHKERNHSAIGKGVFHAAISIIF